MQTNTCGKTDTTSTVATAPLKNSFSFGVFAATFPKDQPVSIEVPSGNDRKIRIYGMKMPVSSAACPALNLNDPNTDQLLNGFTPPVFLGEATNINMSPGATVTVPVPITSVIDTTNYFDNCNGKDSGNGNQNPGDGNKPYLRLEGLYGFMHFDNGSQAPIHIKPITTGVCIPVSLSIFTPSNTGSNSYSVQAPLTISFPPVTEVEFHQNNSCNDAVLNSVTISTGASSRPGLFMKVLNPGPTYSFNLGLSSTSEVTYSSDGAFDVGMPVLSFNFPATAPTRLVNNKCYPFKALLFEADGKTPLNTTLNSLTFGGSGASRVYASSSLDGKTCSSALSNFSITASSESPVMYYQTPTTGSFSDNLFVSGPFAVVNSTAVQTSLLSEPINGDAVATSLVFDIPAVIEVNQCVPVRISLRNQSLFVPAPTSFKMQLGLTSNAVGNFYANSQCGGNPFRSSGAFPNELSWNEGDFTKTIYFKPLLTSAGTAIELKNTPLGIRPSSQTQSAIFTISSPSTGVYGYFASFPNFFQATNIPSINFNGPGKTYPMPILTSAGVNVGCHRGSPNGTDCSALISVGPVLNWAFADIQADSDIWLTFGDSSGVVRYSIWLKPSNLFGTSKNYVDCPVGNILSGSNLNPSLMSSGGVYCLTSGSSIDMANTNISLANSDLYGPVDQSAQINFTGSGFIDFGNPGIPRHIGNVTLNALAGTTASQFIDIAGSGNQVWIDNVKLRMNGNLANFSGININSANSFVNIYSLSGDTPISGASTGINFIKSVNLDSTKILTISGVDLINDQITNLTGITILDNLETSISLAKFKYNGLSQAISVSNTSGGSFHTNLTALDWNIISNGGNAVPNVQISQAALVTLSNSYLEKQNIAAVTLQVTGANVNLSHNTFVQNMDASAVGLNGTNTINNFAHNQFVRFATAAANPYPISLTTGTINSPDVSSSGTNLFCSLNAGNGWDASNRVGFVANSGLFDRTNTYSASLIGASYIFNNRCTSRNP